MFRNLFKPKVRNKEKLYNIAINDEAINRNMSKLILNLQEDIKHFRHHLESPAFSQTDSDLSQMYESAISVKRHAKELYDDVEKIISIEMDNKEYFIIKDDVFLLDKREQLKQIKAAADHFLEIIEQKPSKEDLRGDLFSRLVQSLNKISSSINKIIKDDNGLRVIYKTLSLM